MNHNNQWAAGLALALLALTTVPMAQANMGFDHQLRSLCEAEVALTKSSFAVTDPCGLLDDGFDPTACIVPSDGKHARIIETACRAAGNGPGQITMACSLGGFVCASASAHAEYEEVAGMPNLYSHMTSGSGFNPNGLSGGNAVITTTLGSATCFFDAGEGCGRTWSDAASVCIKLTANTVATAILQAKTTAIDRSCGA